MIVADVMDEIAAQLETIDELRGRVHAFNTHLPAVDYGAMVDYPETYLYDQTYGRGEDRIDPLMVYVFFTQATDRGIRDRVSDFMSSPGDRSVKAVLEAGTYTAFDYLHVTQSESDDQTFNGVDYFVLIFQLSIVGPGT